MKWIKRLFRSKKKENIDAYKDALQKIGFIIVDHMSKREFRRLLQRDKRMYRMIVEVMRQANIKVEENN